MAVDRPGLDDLRAVHALVGRVAQDGEALISRDELADATGLHPVKVRVTLSELEQAGALAADSIDVAEALGYQGTSAVHLGQTDRARAIADQIAALEGPRAGSWATSWRARIDAVLGRRDEAVNLLRQAFSEGLGYGIWLHRDPDFESLHGFKPFDEVMRPSG